MATPACFPPRGGRSGEEEEEEEDKLVLIHSVSTKKAGTQIYDVYQWHGTCFEQAFVFVLPLSAWLVSSRVRMGNLSSNRPSEQVATADKKGRLPRNDEADCLWKLVRLAG